VIHGKPEQVTQINGFAQIKLTTDKHSVPSRNQNENLYGAQPPSAAGINLS